jgi:hypothetical protein
MRVKKLVEWLAKLPERPRTILKTCAYGFVAGLVAVADLMTHGLNFEVWGTFPALCSARRLLRLSVCPV